MRTGNQMIMMIMTMTDNICAYCNEDKAMKGKEYCIECADQAEYEEEYEGGSMGNSMGWVEDY